MRRTYRIWRVRDDRGVALNAPSHWNDLEAGGPYSAFEEAIARRQRAGYNMPLGRYVVAAVSGSDPFHGLIGVYDLVEEPPPPPKPVLVIREVSL
jgi:hypothetical protein